jgi:hypothetical protein
MTIDELRKAFHALPGDSAAGRELLRFQLGSGGRQREQETRLQEVARQARARADASIQRLLVGRG